jgi:exosome complex component RRP42
MMDKEIKMHVADLLKKDARIDGRKPLEYRQPILVEYDIADTAEGSAQVTIGETIVQAGVKLSIGKPYPDTPDEGCLMVGAELLPLSNPEFELGPPGIQAIELGRVVDRGIRESKAIDTKKLCITSNEKVWMVSIDICPINDAGNLFDAAALAALAALKVARFPKVNEDGSVSYMELTDEKLPMRKTPIGVTVIKIGSKFIIDPVTEEEKSVDSRLTVTLDDDGTIVSLQKGGDEALTIDEIMQMVDIAEEKSQELRRAL